MINIIRENIISQNTKQRNGASSAGVQRFSYTLYDELGRVIEAGEKTENTTASTKFNSIFGTTIANYFNPKVIDDSKLNNWIADNTGARKEVTKSYYDETVITGLPSNFNPNPANQRKRIVHATYEDVYDGDDQTFDHASHYDYDVHGNVKTLIQDNQKLANTFSTDPNIVAQRFKRMDYSYDLISGNVHKVEYQNGQADEWNHRYEYDADNRITQVETSTNKIFWDKDAQYKYYAHGPLARTEIGDNQVQGCDYVYTLQGWIKGVNSNTLNENNDPGKDGTSAGSVPGNPNEKFARDVYGYSLGYFTNDYLSIEAANQGTNSFTASISGSDVEANRNDLFNGNIGSMIATITNPVTREILPLGNAYKYDQLNRLLQALSYNNLDLNTSNSTFNSFDSGGTQMYYNSFEYDANGNMMSAVAKDDAGNYIDYQTYNYQAIGGKKINNRLYAIQDTAVDDSKYGLFDQLNFDNTPNSINIANNYRYDETGNLIYNAQDSIISVEWTVFNKPKAIYHAAGCSKGNVKFEYDGFYNRIAKHIYKSDSTWLYSEYYVKDAQGNIMTVYKHSYDDMLEEMSFKATEQHIYGSSNFGLRKDSIEMIETTLDSVYFVRVLGKKHYSLANHLSSTNIVITDKKISVESVNNPGEVEYFVVGILSSKDYAPFGGDMKGRDFNSSNYPNSFNGKRDDEELGDWQDYGGRMYMKNARKFISPDGFQKAYPSLSSYHSFNNNPLLFIDANGNYLVIKGSAQSVEKFRTQLQNGLGDKVKVQVAKDGTVTLHDATTGEQLCDDLSSELNSALTESERKFYYCVSTIANSDEVTVNVLAVSHGEKYSNQVETGSFGVNDGEQLIDVDDIAVFPTDEGLGKPTQRGAIIHELAERYNANLFGEDYDPSHLFAQVVEQDFYNAKIEYINVNVSSNKSLGVEGSFTGQYYFKYTKVNNDGTTTEHGFIIQYLNGDLDKIMKISVDILPSKDGGTGTDVSPGKETKETEAPVKDK